MAESPLKKTPLHPRHQSAGARMVPFAGWDMPLQFSGILDEHKAVREAAGLFDISHMVQLHIAGPAASAWLDGLLTNSVAKLASGTGHYTLLLDETGGVIDDLILYRVAADAYFAVLNAAVEDDTRSWLTSHLPSGGGVHLEFVGEWERAAVALQGPASERILSKLALPLPGRNQITQMHFEEAPIALAGTGYTGESGCEIFCSAEAIEPLWQRLLEAGREFGLKPCGLGARDTLRLEMCFPLNGADLNPARTPLEAGLGAFVDLTKPSFIGREKLQRQKEDGIADQLCALLLDDGSPPPRPHYGVFARGAKVSEITSGALSPTLNRGIALAYLPHDAQKIGSRLDVEIRGRHFGCCVVKKPFLRKALSA